ncbi:hypothetical protein [Rhizorhapis sp. SPR117]|uniref:hypothetical protein n=1 Tax=Rhizorhapis sp. SPR117 TaxID=2912611 RepID=UPI001F476CB1|nr:hypothetical protein [Rhizorhapis sp. SPR117]
MNLPKPVPGLVLRYAFLWSHEAAAGAEEGSKDRPCAVLLTTTTRDGRDVVTVLPVTHTPPEDEALAVEIPPSTKVRLGLDGERSWIILSEANRFSWPGPDLRPIAGDETGRVDYGLLSAALYDRVRTKWLAAYDRQRVGQINRTE